MLDTVAGLSGARTWQQVTDRRHGINLFQSDFKIWGKKTRIHTEQCSYSEAINNPLCLISPQSHTHRHCMTVNTLKSSPCNQQLE